MRTMTANKPEADESENLAPVEIQPEAKPAETQRADEFYGQLLKLKAEFENYRKRVDRDRPEWIRMGEVRVIERLLPILDALILAQETLKNDKTASKELVLGFELIFKELSKFFETEGVTKIETVGKPYSHDLHEVLGSVETNEHPDGTVVEELQRGYTFQAKVLRPARVRIAKNKAKEA